MSKLKKKVAVKVFSIKAYGSFFDDFIAVHDSSKSLDKPTRLINIRDKKYLIKMQDSFGLEGNECYFLSVVRERNTWQTRGLNDGAITGISLNQGIIGDPFYFVLVPDRKVILGFTTCPGDSLKSTAVTVLQQFSSERTSKIVVEQVSRETEYEKLKEVQIFKEIKVTVDLAKLFEQPNRVPMLLEGISQTRFLKRSKLALTISDLEEYDQAETCNYLDELIENEGCSALAVQAVDREEQHVSINLGTVYAVFNSELLLRKNFIDEKRAKEVLLNALSYFSTSMKIV
ncbi:hypothetical protein [Halodesulfovibrio spirochaetisodalis]|uniref:Uncharacterized protein n=1 Tax=Halodesulfovibrio spirochaetisodalis TaxID=1560234 RepID=A0A1B7XA59_9BACT|nr:hypothetical protein [Halodesulfovibrio spirochaetisodalis]OBQ46222.1 hypothetical protein SP90_13570 [Halodesulfovibrio spirochaetisodalis]